MVAFPKVRSFNGAGVVIVSFFGNVEFVAGVIWCSTAGIEAGGAAAAGCVVFVAATMTVITFALSFGDYEIFVVVAAVA